MDTLCKVSDNYLFLDGNNVPVYGEGNMYILFILWEAYSILFVTTIAIVCWAVSYLNSHFRPDLNFCNVYRNLSEVLLDLSRCCTRAKEDKLR